MLSACSDGALAPIKPTPTSAVDVVYCKELAPNWVAFQDGDGAWVQAQPTIAGRYATFHHAFATNRGGIATARETLPTLTTLSIQYGAPSELSIVGDTRPDHCAPAEFTTALGSVAGLGANEAAFVSVGYHEREGILAGEDNTFTLFPLRPGPQDILATRTLRMRNGTGATNDGATVTGFILRRSAEVPDSATLPVLDFNSAEAFAPTVRSLTLAGLGALASTVQTGFRTANSENLVAFVASQTPSNVSYFAIPDGKLAPGDLQSITATSAPVISAVRGATVYFHSPTDRTLTFGATPIAPAISVASTTPSVRMRARFAAQADYDRLTSIHYQQDQYISVTVAMTGTYAAGGDYDLIMPDLTGVPGFDPRWVLRSGTTLIWTSFLTGGTLSPALDAIPVDGSTKRVATDAGFFTP
jgi:hypothetical protein